MEKKLQKNVSYILQFIDSNLLIAQFIYTRCMASSLSNLVDNLTEDFHRVKCKSGHYDKKCERCGIKYKYYSCFLEYTNFKGD